MKNPIDASGKSDNQPNRSDYDEERVPFTEVMRKLANTKPPHKAAKAPAPPKTKKS
jgi:hypothetical protein